MAAQLSVSDIARRFYVGPRKFNTALPAYVKGDLAEYVNMVEGKLDKTRLHLANRAIDDLFAKYFNTGRLIGGKGEGLSFDVVTEDGRRVAEIVKHLLDRWFKDVSGGE